jgi:predicted Zn-dependent peptidase
LDLQAKYVVPNNGLLVMVGDIDPARARGLLEKRFGPSAWPARPFKEPKVAVDAPHKKETVKIHRLQKKQAHLVAGFPAPLPSGPDYFAARLLNGVLGEGMDSRLFTEVRDKRGLCYVVNSWFDRRPDPGTWKIYVGTQPEKLEEARKVVLEVVDKIVQEGVTDEEFKNAKAYAKGIFKVARQDFGAEARMIASYEFLGLGAAKIDAYPDLIDKVNKADLQRVAKKYLGSHPPVIAIVKP